MRIAFLLNGMTGYLDAEFRALHALGTELLVVSPVDARTSGDAMADTAFGELDTESYADVIGWSDPPVPDELVAAVSEFGPDAVIMTSWAYTPAYRAVMKAVDARVVRVLIMDNLWLAAGRQWVGRLSHRWYIKPVADAVLVPSDRSEFYARRLGFAPGDTIRGSLTADTSLFRSGKREGSELAARRQFLFVGRLVDHKGADVLAAAYERYRSQASDPWDLDVVGIGPLAHLLEGMPGVRMHGFLQPPAVADLMRASGCVVVPSHVEPYGVVVHEATSCGLPVLCTDLAGAAAGLVQDGYNGWVVPSGDVAAWTAAMLRMSRTEPARLGSMSDVSRAVATRLSPAGWARNLVDELTRRQALGGGRLGAVRPRTRKPSATLSRVRGRIRARRDRSPGTSDSPAGRSTT